MCGCIRVKPKWFPDWNTQTCVIVASGPSAGNVALDRAIGLARFVAINNSWRLAPWADFLFAADYRWWYAAQGCPQFRGAKVTTDRHAGETREWNLHRLGMRLADDRLLMDDIGVVGWGGCSGFQAVNMVAQFGCKRILLVGFDATVKNGLHWHGSYPGADNPTKDKTLRWQRCLDNAASMLASLDVEVVNCSMQSALKKYPKIPFEESVL